MFLFFVILITNMGSPYDFINFGISLLLLVGTLAFWLSYRKRKKLSEKNRIPLYDALLPLLVLLFIMTTIVTFGMAVLMR